MNLSPLPIQKFFDNDGKPLAAGLLFTYKAGTTTKAATYKDSAGASTNTNPIVLDFRGECQLWIDPTLAYKFVLSPANDTDPPTKPIWSVDNISVSAASMDNAAVDTGSVNAIALALPLISSPVAFTRVVFKAANTNTGAVTLSLNGGTAKAITWQNLASLSGGEIQAGGLYEAIYDGAQWQLQGPTLQPPQMRTPAEIAAGITPVNYNYLPGDVRRYGAKVDGVTDDTIAISTALALAGSVAGTHSPEGTVKGVRGTSMVSQINFIYAGIGYQANGMVFRGNAVSATTAVVQFKNMNGCVIQDFAVDCIFNSNYQCAAHWYTNNLNLYYPGNCRFTGSFVVSSALIGLCIGALPGQSLPCPPQGSVQADGIATDAPLSESSIFGIQTISCVIGVWMTQPNGKVSLAGGAISGSHSGWVSYGSSGYTNASTCALRMRNDPTQTSELYLSGVALEQNSESTGSYLQISSSQLWCDGCTVEANCHSYIDGASRLVFDNCLDMGWNFPGNYSPILIDQGASGSLTFSNLTIGYPTGGLVLGTGSPFVKGASNITGTYATNTNGFSVMFSNVELRDVPLAPLGGTSQYSPSIEGVQVHFSNCKYTSYNGTPAITTQYDIDDGLDLLRNVVDESNYTITAYGLNGNTTSGGWAFTVSGASSWGSAASGITQLEKVIDKCLKLTGAAGGSATATSPKFPIEPQHPYLLRGWIQGGATGGSLVIQTNWFKFDNSASGTATTTQLNAADTVIGSTPIPFLFLLMPPKDATQGQIVLSGQNNATMQITDISLR